MDFAKLKIEADSSQVRTADQDLGRLAGTSDNLVGKLKTLAGVIGSSLVMRALINDARQFETQLGGVAKTTGLAGQDLLRFAGRIDELSRKIPVSTGELLTLAQAAGQMGVTGAENLEKFALTVAKLGTASNLAGEEAASSLARILNVTGEAVGSVDVLASVIVSLGNNTAATESEIARMTTEVARATSAFGVNSAEAAAMGAAMASIGIRAELGGSSVGRAMQEITSRVQAGGDELQNFADTLGLNADTLAQLFEDDKTAAFQYFLEQVGELGLDAGNALKDVNLGGQEIAKTIIPLSNNMEIFAKTLGLANAEVENATALNREFEATLGTFNNQFTRSQNVVSSYGRALSNDVMPSITEVLTAFNDFSEDAENFDNVVEGLNFGIEVLAVTLGAKLVGATWKSVAATTAEIAATLKATQVKNAYGQVVARTTALQTGMAASSRGLTAAMGLLGGPAGILAIVAYGLWKVVDGTETLTEKTEKLREEMDKLNRQEMERAIQLQESLIRSIEFEIRKQEARGTAYRAGAENLKRLNTELEEAQKGLQELHGGMKDVEEREFNEMLDEMTEGTEWYTLALERQNDEISENTRETDDNTNSKKFNLSATDELTISLGQELAALSMTGREQAIYQAMVQAGSEATAEEREQIAQLVGVLYDQKAALESTAEAERQAAADAKDLERAQVQAAIEMREEWRNTRDTFVDYAMEMRESGENVFESLEGSFKKMVERMAWQLAASGIIEFFGGQGEFDFKSVLDGSGIAGAITKTGLTKFAPELASSLGLTAAGSVAGGATAAGLTGGGSLLSLAPGLSGGAAGAGVLAPTAGGTGILASAGGMIKGGMAALGKGLAAIPGWGWAIAGALALNEIFGHKETPSFNNGLLLQDIPGVDASRKRDIPAFPSGIDPVMFNRRGSWEETQRVTEIFQGIDTSISALIRQVFPEWKLTGAGITGLAETGLGRGLFFGAAGEEGRPGMPLDDQITLYARGLISTLAGKLDGSTLGQITSQRDATSMIEALAESLGGVPDGSHYSGLSSVPFDGYTATLHRGEEIHTASKVRASDMMTQDLLGKIEELILKVENVGMDASEQRQRLIDLESQSHGELQKISQREEVNRGTI